MHILLFIIFLFQSPPYPMVKNRIEDEKFKLLTNNNDSIYISRSSGILYKPFNKKFIRFDDSYDDKIHVRSLDFFHNDTLYRFGGYGYFNVNKNLIFFDKQSEQWDLIKYKGFDKIEGFSNVGIHFITNNQLHVIGYDSNENEFQNESNYKFKGFVYNFFTKSINRVFKINEGFQFPSAYFQVNDDFVFLFYQGERVLKILNTSSYDLFSFTISQKESWIENKKNESFSLDKNQLKFKIKNIDKTTVIHSIEINSVLNNMKFYGNLIHGGFKSWYLFIIVVILGIMISYYLIVKRKNLLLTPNSLKYGRKSIDIDDKMYFILKLLMGSSEVSNLSLNEVFEISGQNPLHINREKNKCVDQINKLFLKNFGDTLILLKKNENDKRMNLFYFNPKFSPKS